MGSGFLARRFAESRSVRHLKEPLVSLVVKFSIVLEEKEYIFIKRVGVCEGKLADGYIR